MSRILIAGVGNIFHGDDAFGVEVAAELMKREWPAEVEVTDFGIRAYDLAYALADGYDAVILVDATPRGQAPGTVSLIEPDRRGTLTHSAPMIDPHSLNPVTVIAMAAAFGELPARLYLVGCEPARLECVEGEFGLSKPVAAAVPQAITMIRSLVDQLVGERAGLVGGRS